MTLWRTSKDARELLRYAAPRVPRQLLVLAAVACARTADRYLNETTRGPARDALRVTTDWAFGGATLEEVHAAAYADATRLSTLKRCADIVREYYPNGVLLKS